MMDTRLIWILFYTCIIDLTRGAFQNRNMSDCLNNGLNCSKRAACGFDSSSSNFKCLCFPGYKGKLCDEDRNECDVGRDPCTGRGVCHNSFGNFRCDCVPGWQGSHCQTSDGSSAANCSTGYTGVNCTDDFNECTQWTDNPCEHNSTCNNMPGNFSCSCVTGWEGRICNEDINECNLTSGMCRNGGDCTNVPGAYKCVCPYPFTGQACDDISSTLSTKSTTTPTVPITSASIGLTSYDTLNSTKAAKSTHATKLSVVSSVPGSNTTVNSASSNSTVPITSTSIGLTSYETLNSTKAAKSTHATKLSVVTSVPGSNTTVNSASSNSTVPITSTSIGLTSYETLNFTKAAKSTHATKLSVVTSVPGSNTTVNSASSNSTKYKGPQGAQEGKTSGGGGTNVGIIVGPIVGLLVIAGVVGAGIVVHKKYPRISHQIDAEDKNKVETKKQDTTNGDSNENTKWTTTAADP